MTKSGRVNLAVIPILLLAAAAAFAQTSQPGPPSRKDSLFSQLSFDQWRAEGKQSLRHCSFDIVPPELSAFQRLITGVTVDLESPELADHHALVLIQFQDSGGGIWQTHGSLSRQPEYVRNAFVLPGDYSVSVAIYDPVTHRHAFAEKKLHAAPLKAEPLPGAWDGLPQVEFLPDDAELPDGWFLPSITSRLRLPVATRHPVHIDVLLNITPSDRANDSVAELRRNMSAVLPAMKVVSQIELGNGTLDVALLDLVGRRTIAASNWTETRAFLKQANPGIIDVRALDSRWSMRSFFLDQIAKRIGGEPGRVVIVLSGPAFLQDQESATNLALPGDPAPRVFYIRCRLIPRSVLAPRPRPRPGARPRLPPRGAFLLPLDDLERPLNSSNAMLFDVITPEQFRRVLAVVLEEISRL